ncbi:MAG: GatB/YqeY domain-containing protein [Hyphomicrobiales bacterium]|nr:GatB/YqeY domain-containing protein [Hyphomicrobiales bacterium]MBV9114976.1 GatB/YqeY domain-containing protein [Hyphomicrobiales bacterium]MBV9517358.1 GatB/YqeY domain-containing protein [Hyphomicrobiales bacterium]
MSLRDRFTAMMKEAMKAGDKPRLSAVRLINAAVKDRDIEARGAGRKEATEEEIVTLLQKMIKQRQESAALYEKGARPELAAQERAEIAVISSFLPQQLGESEVAEVIEEAIAATGATSIKDMGKVMAWMRERHAGKIDFSKAGPVLKSALSA